MYNIALVGLLRADHKNIKAIASLCPSANTPLSKQVLINNLDQFGEKYPLNLEKDADYGLDYGGKGIYTDDEAIEILTDYFLDCPSTDEKRIYNLISNVVKEDNIIVGKCSQVGELLLNIPNKTNEINEEKDLSNISVEDILFIQCVSPRVTGGWSLATFGWKKEVGLGIDEKVFVLVRDPESTAIVELNNYIANEMKMENYKFCEDISEQLFGMLSPSSTEITEMISSKTGKVDNIEVTGYYKGEVNGGTMADGKGVMKFSNGDIYDGNWKNGKMNGKGAMLYHDGAFYQGDWKDGKPDV